MAKRLNLTHGRLLVAKALKVAGIRVGFLWPTLRAKLLLRWYGCTYGPGLQACGPIHFRPHTAGAIRLGQHVALTARFLTNTVGINQPVMLETLGAGLIDIGHHSGLTAAILSARTRIQIGDYVKIGGNVRIFDHDFHSRDYHHRRNGAVDAQHVASAAITIGDDVFIGAHSLILKGTCIGPRSIIGAGCVVTRMDIPADSLVAGNPARILRTLVSERSV